MRSGLKLLSGVALAAGLMLAGCEEGGYGKSSGASSSYCSSPIPGRLSAPVRYTVPSRRPSIRNSREFSACAAPAGYGAPKLQPLKSSIASGGYNGIKPLSVSIGNGADGSMRRLKKPWMCPSDLQPVQQLIYGGDYDDHDAPEPYKFGVRDKFTIRVAGHPEFSGAVEVGQGGKIFIPNTDNEIEVIDRTEHEVEAAIIDALRPYTVRLPKVSVTVSFARSGYYYIFGEVDTAGRFPLGLRPIRLSEAVFRANSRQFGSSAFAGREESLREEMELSPRTNFELSKYTLLNKVSVITPHRSRPTRRVYNVKAALMQGITGQDPVVRPGQIIWVPTSFDKKMMDFFARVIEPLRAVGDMDAESAKWYRRFTGNAVRGVVPTAYSDVNVSSSQ